jgi:hypothetical protein
VALGSPNLQEVWFSFSIELHRCYIHVFSFTFLKHLLGLQVGEASISARPSINIVILQGLRPTSKGNCLEKERKKEERKKERKKEKKQSKFSTFL